MPTVQIEMLQGRTIEQKRKLVEKVTEAIAGSLTCPREAVTIIIREMAPEHFAKGGILRIDNK
ncbi:MAG: 4-oxalocrotonate tautomerase [Bacillota bacterium]|nr:MAG: 4-oxalocrotonate tautomerase [Bacillota bacterium]MBS3950231.1 4-oxalocrotonate tautomerase [Peptococcaceae bacterium]